MADTITNKPRRKYSCEQVYERMESGLCLFCEELDSPGHYELKHKRTQIFLIESDVDPASDDKELVPVALHQKEDQANTVVEEKLNLSLGNNIEHLEGKHSHKEDSVMLIKPSNDVKLLFSQEYSRSRKSEMVLPILVNDCTTEKRFTCLSQADRIWEPGGLITKQDLWNLRENRNHEDVLELTSQLHGKDLQRNASKGMTDVSPRLDRLETYGWEYKKCMSLFVSQGSKVEESPLLKVLRDSETYSSRREFEWFLRNGAVYYLNRFCTNRKRPLDPGIGFISLQTNPEMSILLVKETRDWYLKSRFKIHSCSGFDLASWNGLEIHGREKKKHVLLLVNHVWDRGGLIATHAFGSILVQSDISFDVLAAQEEERFCIMIIYEMAETLEKLAKTWQFKFKSSSVNTRFMLLGFSVDGRTCVEELQSYILVKPTSKSLKLLTVYEYLEIQTFSCVTQTLVESPNANHVWKPGVFLCVLTRRNWLLWVHSEGLEAIQALWLLLEKNNSGIEVSSSSSDQMSKVRALSKVVLANANQIVVGEMELQLGELGAELTKINAHNDKWYFLQTDSWMLVLVSNGLHEMKYSWSLNKKSETVCDPEHKRLSDKEDGGLDKAFPLWEPTHLPVISYGTNSYKLFLMIETSGTPKQLENATCKIRSESIIGQVENSFTEICVYGIFHLQRPPELGQVQRYNQRLHQNIFHKRVEVCREIMMLYKFIELINDLRYLVKSYLTSVIQIGDAATGANVVKIAMITILSMECFIRQGHQTFPAAERVQNLQILDQR